MERANNRIKCLPERGDISKQNATLQRVIRLAAVARGKFEKLLRPRYKTFLSLPQTQREPQARGVALGSAPRSPSGLRADLGNTAPRGQGVGFSACLKLESIGAGSVGREAVVPSGKAIAHEKSRYLLSHIRIPISGEQNLQFHIPNCNFGFHEVDFVFGC